MDHHRRPPSHGASKLQDDFRAFRISPASDPSSVRKVKLAMGSDSNYTMRNCSPRRKEGSSHPGRLASFQDRFFGGAKGGKQREGKVKESERRRRDDDRDDEDMSSHRIVDERQGYADPRAGTRDRPCSRPSPRLRSESATVEPSGQRTRQESVSAAVAAAAAWESQRPQNSHPSRPETTTRAAARPPRPGIEPIRHSSRDSGQTRDRSGRQVSYSHGSSRTEPHGDSYDPLSCLPPASKARQRHGHSSFTIDTQSQRSSSSPDRYDTTSDEFTMGYNQDSGPPAVVDEEFERIYAKLPKNIVREAAEKIYNEQVKVTEKPVRWSDIFGLDSTKQALKEATVYPLLRPDLFFGLRDPGQGVLLFGPPGTGKTMLARAVATESKATFFAITASTLCAKYYGESENLVRALFAMAKQLAPSVIFVDEVDSILSSRNSQSDTMKRLQTEFLIQWSSLTHDVPPPAPKTASKAKTATATTAVNGTANGANDKSKCASGQGQVETKDQSKTGDQAGENKRVLVLGATNLPWNIDTAAIRRFSRRQFIPLPEPETRREHLRQLLKSQKHGLCDDDLEELVDKTEGYSGSDITQLARSAAMMPLRKLGDKILTIRLAKIPKLSNRDFVESLSVIRASVPTRDLAKYRIWANSYSEVEV